MEQNRSSGNEVLSDHRRVGKRFIPPFIDKVPPITEVRWMHLILPEILWLGVLSHALPARAPAVAVALANTTQSSVSETKRRFYGTTSAYSSLTVQQQHTIVDVLRENHNLAPLHHALGPLVFFYPECPFSFLFEGQPPLVNHPRSSLMHLRALLMRLLFRRGQEATMMQATAVYIAFMTDLLKVTSSSSLANFPEIENYPTTEESRRVAASVRATITQFVAEHSNPSATWSVYFWNRGLSLQPCEFNQSANCYG